MAWTVFVVSTVLWLLGIVSFRAVGAPVHSLLVPAVIALIQLIRSRGETTRDDAGSQTPQPRR